MRIGLFGDSLVQYDTEGSWPYFLSKLLNCEIKSMGVGGSSLFHAYKKICRHYYDFDLIILSVTNHGRLYFDDTAELHINCADTAQLLIQSPRRYSDLTIEKAKAALGYYNFLQNEEFDSWVHNKILEEITSNYNIKFLPNFIVEACIRENVLLGIEDSMTLDLRMNHLSKMNSPYIAECMKEYINDGSIIFDVTKIQKPDKNIEPLYEMVKNTQ